MKKSVNTVKIEIVLRVGFVKTGRKGGMNDIQIYQTYSCVLQAVP